MILASHNAYLTDVSSPPVPADPGLGIPGSGPVSKWSGLCQIHMRPDTDDVIRQGERVRFTQNLVTVPANLPTYPETEDVLTFQLPDGSTQVQKVFSVDTSYAALGKIVVTTRPS